MSLQFIKQMLALLLIGVAIIFTVIAVNENNYTYILGTIISGLVSYLLVKKKI